MADVVRPSGNAMGAPKGSENYLAKLEAYADKLEDEAASLYKRHEVVAMSVIAGVAGFLAGLLVASI